MDIDKLLEPKFIEGQYVQNKYYLEGKTLVHSTLFEKIKVEPVFKFRYKQVYKINDLWVIVKHVFHSCCNSHEIYYREYTGLWGLIKSFMFTWKKQRNMFDCENLCDVTLRKQFGFLTEEESIQKELRSKAYCKTPEYSLAVKEWLEKNNPKKPKNVSHI